MRVSDREVKNERKRLFRDLVESHAWETLMLPTLTAKMEELKRFSISQRCDIESLRAAQGKYEAYRMLCEDPRRFFGIEENP